MHYPHPNGQTLPWTKPQHEILLQCCDAGKSDREIVQALLDAGFPERTTEAVRKVRLGLGRIRKTGKRDNGGGDFIKAAPKKKNRYPALSDEQGQYWGRAKRADERFRDAMHAAGYPERQRQVPATERPLIVSRPVAVRSSGYGDAW